jgi:hypothetical protein
MPCQSKSRLDFGARGADPLDAQQLWETMIANLAKLLKHG